MYDGFPLFLRRDLPTTDLLDIDLINKFDIVLIEQVAIFLNHKKLIFRLDQIINLVPS